MTKNHDAPIANISSTQSRSFFLTRSIVLSQFGDSEQNTNLLPCLDGRRPQTGIGIMATILASLHMQTADDLVRRASGKPTL